MEANMTDLISFVVDLIYTTPNHTVIACATDAQLERRNSRMFMVNVLVNLVFLVLMLIGTWKAARRLKKKSPFPLSTTTLLYFCLVNGLLHEFDYTVIQVSSLYRAWTYHAEPCKIMFTEYECFPWYTMNIYSRLLISSTFAALALDGFLLLETKRKDNSWFRPICFYTIAHSATIACTRFMASDGPNDNPQPNCLSRQGRPNNSLIFQVSVYLLPMSVCAVVIIRGYFWARSRKKRNGEYDVNIRLKDKTALTAAKTISIIICTQMILQSIYSLSVPILLMLIDIIGPGLIGDVVLWFYTYTYSSLLLPYGLIYLMNKIEASSRRRTEKLVNVNVHQNGTENHMEQLDAFWDAKFLAAYGHHDVRANQIVPID